MLGGYGKIGILCLRCSDLAMSTNSPPLTQQLPRDMDPTCCTGLALAQADPTSQVGVPPQAERNGHQPHLDPAVLADKISWHTSHDRCRDSVLPCCIPALAQCTLGGPPPCTELWQLGLSWRHTSPSPGALFKGDRRPTKSTVSSAQFYRHFLSKAHCTLFGGPVSGPVSGPFAVTDE